MKLIRKFRAEKSKIASRFEANSEDKRENKKAKKKTVMVFAFPYSISESLPSYKTRG